jgi:hypothetical protein
MLGIYIGCIIKTAGRPTNYQQAGGDMAELINLEGELGRRVEQLAASPQAQALERMIEMLIGHYLAFFYQHGVPNLMASIRIEVSPNAAIEQQTRELQLSLLEYFAKQYRTNKRGKAKIEAAEQIKNLLGKLSFSQRGH